VPTGKSSNARDIGLNHLQPTPRLHRCREALRVRRLPLQEL
jgi:hypothetical protein